MKEKQPKEKIIEVPNAFYFDDEINERSRREFCTTLDLLAQNNKEVGIIVTSRGGSVDELSLMIDQMDRVRTIYDTKINTIAQGYAYSGGAVLVALGDTRYAFPNTNFLIHDFQVGSSKETLSERRSDVVMARRQQRWMEKRLMQKMGKTLPEVHSLWNKYLSEHQALEEGLIDGIIIYSK